MNPVHDESSVMRVLIYRLGSLGDTLVALPAFHLVRERFPHARVTLLSGVPVSGQAPSVPSVLEHTGLIDEAIDFSIGLREWSAIQELRRQLRERQFDLVIHLAAARQFHKSLRDLLFFKSCGVRRVIGVPLRRRELRCRPTGAGDSHEPEMERLLYRLRSLGQADLRDPRWRDLRLTAAEEAEATLYLQTSQIPAQFIVASVGAKSEIKDWTLPNWQSLIRHLGREYPNLGLVLIGAANEHARSEEIRREWLGPRANLCGLPSVRVSAAILKRARLFVGHDSGPMHLAATVGTSCVAVFTARNPPGQWFPHGENHTVLYHRTPCLGCGLSQCATHRKQCILSISPAEVLAAVRRQLGRSLDVERPALSDEDRIQTR
jgi:ADP-heptose:LPS heptosyltransferase